MGLASSLGPGPDHSVIDPATPEAARIAGSWWVMLALALVAILIVAVLLAMALWHTRTGKPKPMGEGMLLGGGLAASVILLLPVGVLTIWVAVDLASEPDNTVHVDVIGHQFWWEIHYPESGAVTANELHLPVGTPVSLRFVSADVIHSFWVPSLHGKVDLFPERETFLNFTPETEGVFRGQCAEFCGIQHANMSFLVVVMPPDDFEEWLERARAPASTPETESERRGLEVFHSANCVYCHTVRGTSARATIGPDLTRIASRQTLAAGRLTNTRQNLAAWILDPQGIKRGNRMPATHLPPDQLEDLLDYLESLK